LLIIITLRRTRISIKTISLNDRQDLQQSKELEILQTLKSDHLIEFKGSFNMESSLCIATEYYEVYEVIDKNLNIALYLIAKTRSFFSI
jgi:hypothetical protein